MEKPTINFMRDLWREDYSGDDYEEVTTTLDGRWRHGTEHTFIAKRLTDETYWAVGYRTDKDGDYNDFRDGSLTNEDVYQVKPVAKTIIEYKSV